MTGTQVYQTAGQVVSGLDIHGQVRIQARNVTIKNSIIRGGASSCARNSSVVDMSDGGSGTIQDSELVASSPNACLDGIWAFDVTLVRMEIRNVVDGVKAFDNVTVQDSYIHNLAYFASDPNQGGNRPDPQRRRPDVRGKPQRRAPAHSR